MIKDQLSVFVSGEEVNLVSVMSSVSIGPQKPRLVELNSSIAFALGLLGFYCQGSRVPKVIQTTDKVMCRKYLQLFHLKWS